MDQLYDELLVELECPICTNYMSPPIRQCTTGHSICEPCRRKLPKCPLCQGNFTDQKNINLEALARKMFYPCINKSSGCMSRLKFEEREEHEKNCTFKGFKCAIEKCTWIGKLDEIKNHWASKKMTSKPYHASNVCHTKLKSDSYYANIVEAYDVLFWFKCKSSNGQLFWSVQYIGDKADANNYYYEIEIFKPGQLKCRILLSDYCQTIDLENPDLFKEGVCILTTTDAINHFVGDDQLLLYYMRVLQVVNDQGQNKREGKKHYHKHRDHSQGPFNKNNKEEKHEQKFKKNPQQKKTF